MFGPPGPRSPTQCFIFVSFDGRALFEDFVKWETSSRASHGTHIVTSLFDNWLISTHYARVKRGVSARHPIKQPLNDADIDRIKEIAHVELEDAHTELERASTAAQFMDQRNEDGDDSGDGDDIVDDDGDDSAWVECVFARSCCRLAD